MNTATDTENGKRTFRLMTFVDISKHSSSTSTTHTLHAAIPGRAPKECTQKHSDMMAHLNTVGLTENQDYVSTFINGDAESIAFTEDAYNRLQTSLGKSQPVTKNK